MTPIIFGHVFQSPTSSAQCLPHGTGSSAQLGSKSGLCALELQRACPMAAVLYASATGATELRHLGYLERLGLWGPGRPHRSFEELRNAVEGGGDRVRNGAAVVPQLGRFARFTINIHKHSHGVPRNEVPTANPKKGTLD